METVHQALRVWPVGIAGEDYIRNDADAELLLMARRLMMEVHVVEIMGHAVVGCGMTIRDEDNEDQVDGFPPTNLIRAV